MKNSKKFLCTLLAAMMSLSVFASCGENISSSENDGSTTPPPVEITEITPYDGSAVTIKFKHLFCSICKILAFFFHAKKKKNVS